MWNDDENNFVLIKSLLMYNDYDDGDNDYDNGDNDNKYNQSIISRYHIYMVDDSRYLYHH